MKFKNFFKDYIIPILVAVILALIIRQFLFFKIMVPTASMYPTIKDNDQIIVTRIYNKNSLKRGDILVFKSDELNEELIKRLIGLPNDTIKIDEDGSVYVNGSKLNQSYVLNSGGKSGSFKVPEGHYFFLGDNRSNSLDSRYWKEAYIDWKDIEGKARFVIYPFNRFGMLK